jgi:hypothetical protein
MLSKSNTDAVCIVYSTSARIIIAEYGIICFIINLNNKTKTFPIQPALVQLHCVQNPIIGGKANVKIRTLFPGQAASLAATKRFVLI